VTLDEPVALDSAGHQAVLDCHLGLQLVDQVKADHQQQQSNGHARQTRRLPVGGVFILLDKPGTFLLHTGRYTASWGDKGKQWLRAVNETMINAAP